MFFFVMSLLLLFFFMLGNYQDFLNPTQLLLLALLRVSLGLELVCGAWLAGFLVYRNIHERRPLIVRWILLVLGSSLCLLLLVGLRFVQQWLQS
ncbi:MAG TPA: hypothetical protein VHE79_03010 [Spirochaetia bacterium]